MTSNSRVNRQPITFVICAAGKGERFVKHGLSTPKPLLKINNVTMLERSINSLKPLPEDQVIIITFSDHKIPKSDKYEMLEITQQTRGQLETFMFAKNKIRYNRVVIYNCDTYFESNELENLLSGDDDGIIPCSQEEGTAWSFCRIDQNKNVTQVAEKKRISDWASVGYYYFKDKNLLFQLAHEELSEVTDKEVYVAPLYERYLSLGLNIKMAAVEKFLPFGTIEQVQDYWGISLEEFIAQNS